MKTVDHLDVAAPGIQLREDKPAPIGRHGKAWIVSIESQRGRSSIRLSKVAS
jgi:hypothetical protein